MIDKVTLYHEASKGGFKQWSIWIEPDLQTVTVEWGIVGKTLQRSSDTAKPKGKVGTKSYKDANVCARENYERQLRKKTEEGYRNEMGGERRSAVLEAESSDWLEGLNKLFVPAKPVNKIDDDVAAAGLLDGTLLAQRKRDGRRVLALKTRSGKWRLYSRRMEELTGHLQTLIDDPETLDGLSRLDIPNGTIFDGEVIVDREGHDDFRATGTFTNPATDPADAQARIVALEQGGSQFHPPYRARVRYYVFDILYYDGNACWALPYSERLELLERELGSKAQVTGRIMVAERFPNATLPIMKAIVKENKWEGLVLWRLNDGTFLRSGGKPKRTGCAKWKPIIEQDFIATGYFLGSGELSDVGGGLTLAEYAPDGQTLRDCGKVGTGFDAAMRKDMMTWTYPCVVTVKFDSQEPTAKLRFPVFLKKHEDKTPDEIIGNELDELESDDDVE